MKYCFLLLIISILVLFNSCSENTDIQTDETEDCESVEYVTADIIPAETEDIIEIDNIEADKIDNNEIIYFSEKFVLKETPKDDEWLRYKNSSIIQVSKKFDNTLCIVTDTIQKYSHITTYSLSDGYFVGCNGGEFIGDLVYIHYGIEDSDRFHWISNENIVGFYELDKYNDTVYYLTGNYHLITSGYVKKLIKENGIWKKDENFNLVIGEYEYVPRDPTNTEYNYQESYQRIAGNYPEDFIVEDDIVYISTGLKLFMIKDEQVFKLMENFYWSINSVVYINGKLFLGMRGGIGKYDIETDEFLWYEKVLE